MNSHLKSALPLLEFIHSLDKKERGAFLNRCKNNVIKTIVDIIWNVYRGNLNLPPTLVEELRPLKNRIKRLCAKKKSLKSRRKEIILGDLFTTLFSILLPFFLGSTLSRPKATPLVTPPQQPTQPPPSPSP